MTTGRVVLLLFITRCLFPLVGEAQQKEAPVFESFNAFTRQWMEKLSRAKEFRMEILT